jgi:hypothetical protein
MNASDILEILAIERIRFCRDLRLMGEKAGNFVPEVDAGLPSAPGL